MRWDRKHLLDMNVFDRADLDELLVYAEHYASGKQYPELCRGKILATAFFEPSTRTKKSLQAAMLRLGGTYIDMDDEEKSSRAKGESDIDTLRMLSGYSDIVAIRHSCDDAVAQFASVLGRPVINAGNGSSYHPTQTILDLYTIQKEKGSVDNNVVTMVGDLLEGRTVHSLAAALSNYDVHVVGICPDGLSMPDEYVQKVKYEERVIDMIDLDDTLAEIHPDVIYATRMQKERLTEEQKREMQRFLYIITPETMNRLPEHAILMHPLPRPEKEDQTGRSMLKPATWDIDTLVDDDPRAVYYRQAAYGVPTRMAVIATLLYAGDRTHSPNQ